MSSLARYVDWPSCSEAQEHFIEFTPFVAQTVSGSDALPSASRLGSTRQRIDVSCVPPGEEFNGNPAIREQVQLNMDDIMDAFGARKKGTDHWMLKADLHLYLSQCCLFSADESSTQLSVPEIVGCIPEILSTEYVDSVNAWVNLFDARSTVHYDANHNFLWLVEGAKRVYLMSPKLTPLMRPVSAFGETHNHALLGREEALSLVQAYSATGLAYAVDVNAGDVLFIPEGWWHMVDSVSCSYALNFWFLSPLSKLLRKAPNIAPYALRSLANMWATKQTMETIRVGDRFMNEVPSSSTFIGLSTLVQRAKCVASLGERNSLYCSLSQADESSLRAVWVPFAKQNPEEWTAFLLGITAEGAFRLLENWDSFPTDDNSSVFDNLFEPCGDRVSEVRATLIGQRNRHLEVAGCYSLRLLLGSAEAEAEAEN